jgi:tol-pal system protein YbgF
MLSNSRPLSSTKSLVVRDKGFVFLVALVLSPILTAAEKSPTMNMTIDQRLSRLERLQANDNFVDLFARVESLQRELDNIRGEVEVLSHDVKNLKKQQKDIYSDLDKRIQAAETRVESVSEKIDVVSRGGLLAPSFGTSGGAATANNTPAGLVLPVQEQDAYQKAFNQIKEGKYKEAITQFQIFLLTYPSGTYADNAQYWMAESYYVLRDYKAAIVEFGKVLAVYPQSQKIPDAFLKIGFAYYEQEDWPNARRNLETVVAKFPDSSAAKLAGRRLAQMKADNR